MRRQSSRIAAFLQADARPMLCWPRSASTARSQVWLGLPNDHFQSGGNPGSPQQQHGGGPLVVSCGQYVQRAANVCRWPGGREDGRCKVALTSTFVTWRVYGMLRILRSAHMSNASMREHWSFVVDHVLHRYNMSDLVLIIYYATATTTFSFCLTGLFFLGLLQDRLNLLKVS